MSRYRRILVPGATYFFTVALADRKSCLLVEEIDRLRKAYGGVHRSLPFTTIAVAVLPDHIHAVWKLPEGDADYSLRWSRIKAEFSRGLPAVERSPSKQQRREKGIWQRRFWEHQIRDHIDLERHVDYIHYNPVKHGLGSRVSDWPHSSFHRYVSAGWLSADWAGDVREAVGFGERD